MKGQKREKIGAICRRSDQVVQRFIHPIALDEHRYGSCEEAVEEQQERAGNQEQLGNEKLFG
jgi:hypothetical protein